GAAAVDPPPALAPCPSVTVVVAPLVQVTLTVPVPLSAVVAFAETGSYAPNDTAAVEIVQFALTEAVTARFEVAVAASVLVAAPIASAAIPAAISLPAFN